MLMPFRKFYSVKIEENTQDQSGTHTCRISKIWHVEMTGSLRQNAMTCRIETFRRQQTASQMPQGEKDLWRRLAAINDDVSIIMTPFGIPINIHNDASLALKASDACHSIRNSYKGEVIENLLCGIEEVYQSPALLLSEITHYKQFGLLLLGIYGQGHQLSRTQNLHLHQYNTIIEIDEQYTRVNNINKFTHFQMIGIAKPSEAPNVQLEQYMGNILVDMDDHSIHRAELDVVVKCDKSIIKKKYVLQSLSNTDIECL